MARQYEIKRKDITGGGFTGSGPRSIQDRQIVTYQVLVSDDQGAPITPSTITEQLILKETVSLGIPEVNKSQFVTQDPDGNDLIAPWLLATQKTVTRDTGNPLLFNIRVQFDAGTRFSIAEQELYLIAPPLTVSAYPFLREYLWDDEMRVVYSDAKSSAKDELRLPNGQPYGEPFRRQHPRRILRQTQYEPIDTIDALVQTIEDRLYNLNDDAWPPTAGPIQGNPFSWKITNIEYQFVNAYTDPLSISDACILTYTLEHTKKQEGWLDRRPQVDYYYLQTANDFNSITPHYVTNGGNLITLAYLDPDGTLAAAQTGDPPVKDYQIQPSQGFAVFLRD